MSVYRPRPGRPTLVENDGPETPRRPPPFINQITLASVDDKLDACIGDVRKLVAQHADMVSRTTAIREEMRLLRSDVDASVQRLSDVIMTEVIPINGAIARLRDDLNLSKDERLRDSKVTEDLTQGLVHVAKAHADREKIEAERSRDQWATIGQVVIKVVIPALIGFGVIAAAVLKSCS